MSTKKRGTAASPMETAAPKRRRQEQDTHFPDRETVETTVDLGLKIVRLLKRSQDKSGRNVAIHFLDLPSRVEYPDYYQSTPMPLSLNSIEQKLINGDYDTMERLEADLKRMVQNAKDYNASRSEVFEDAERIRKALSNFMPKHNPAYLNPDYRAVPTPIPQAMLDTARGQSVSTNGVASVPEKVKLVFSTNQARRRQSQAISTDGEENYAAELTAAQLLFLDDLSAQNDSINFEEKPSKREIPHYYKVIKQPTSINDVRGMVDRGELKDWNALAREVRLIWENAKEYNEPESEIVMIAEVLESWSEEKLRGLGAAPRTVTRLSLSQPKPKQLKLTIGSATPTPTLTGGAIDNESLRRQKEEMGQALSRANRTSSRGTYINGSTPMPTPAATVRQSVSTAEVNDVPMTGMTESAPARQVNPVSVAPALAMPPLSRIVPTPVMDGEPPAYLPPPAIANGSRHPEAAYNPTTRSLQSDSDNPLERKYRDPGKSLKDALLASVTYQTHPSLPKDPKWKLARYASSTKTQTSSYIYLPFDHFYLRVIPTLTNELRSRRNQKVCLTHNWQLIAPAPSAPISGTYELRLSPGENVIAVDVIASLKEGERKEYAPPQLQLDFERITFFIYLMPRPQK